MNADGLWKIEEAKSAFKVRKHARFRKHIDHYLALLDSKQRTIGGERTVTQNISKSGAAVYTTLDVGVGERVKFICEQFDFSGLAVVCNRQESESDEPARLHLQFVENTFPVELMNLPEAINRTGLKSVFKQEKPGGGFPVFLLLRCRLRHDRPSYSFRFSIFSFSRCSSASDISAFAGRSAVVGSAFPGIFRRIPFSSMYSVRRLDNSVANLYIPGVDLVAVHRHLRQARWQLSSLTRRPSSLSFRSALSFGLLASRLQGHSVTAVGPPPNRTIQGTPLVSSRPQGGARTEPLVLVSGVPRRVLRIIDAARRKANRRDRAARPAVRKNRLFG